MHSTSDRTYRPLPIWVADIIEHDAKGWDKQNNTITANAIRALIPSLSTVEDEPSGASEGGKYPKPWRGGFNGTVAGVYSADGDCVKWGLVETAMNQSAPSATEATDKRTRHELIADLVAANKRIYDLEHGVPVPVAPSRDAVLDEVSDAVHDAIHGAIYAISECERIKAIVKNAIDALRSTSTRTASEEKK